MGTGESVRTLRARGGLVTRLLASISALALAPCAGVPRDVSAQEADDRYADVMERSAWWREARFGMFIHFGAYAVPARGESVQSNERLSVAGHRPYVESFRPVDNDPSAWARRRPPGCSTRS